MGAHKYKCFFTVVFVLIQCTLFAQQAVFPRQTDRWTIQHDGSIAWNIKNDRLPHADHIEISGEKVSLWVSYRIDTPAVAKIIRTVVFPTFRMLPDDTRSNIAYTFQDDELPRIYINNELLKISSAENSAGNGMAVKV